MRVRPDHPLQHLFADLIQRHLIGFAGLAEIEVARYLAQLLVSFTHVDALYRIRDARGRRLEDVGEMLLESNPLDRGSSFFHEREVRKHIADYTMFLCGLFPEYVAKLPNRGLRLDSMVDYIKVGRESYGVVASFDQFEFRAAAPLFRQLQQRFELSVFGLNRIKQELEHNQRTWYRGIKETAGL